ncbi:unnamed protein product [Albugo candida]|uniref:Uncharacterized protein n=1 Tax=Albugo candida TaxID=65357 RepID=A0A024G5S1_9STRA|nr:unnamed protein product [Albugo candida]|eukprot:CCI42112.1 unnamed protein product [Albugo candida]
MFFSNRFVRVREATRHVQTSTKHNSLLDRLRQELADIKDAGTYKQERVIRSSQGPNITVKNQQVLNFCANNYLGLSNHPSVVDAAKESLITRGFGLSSVRFICGTQDIHKELEQVISQFHHTEDTILYPSCFDANAGFFEAILGKQDAILTDELNHASIIDGIRLCKAERHRYKHMDMKDLESKLKETQHCRTRMIATDGVFSMDGDVAPLKDICDLADRYDAQVFIDECHATGLFGATGRGSDEYCGVRGRIQIINSTLGKALGGATGGYTTGPKEIIEILRQRSRPYLFSNSLSPPVVGASLHVFKLLQETSEFVDTIRQNTHRFRDQMTEAGFTLKGSRDHPIVAVMVGDARLASQLADDMLTRGIYVIGFSYPVVPKGQARIRVQLSAAHSLEHIDKAPPALGFVMAGNRNDSRLYVKNKQRACKDASIKSISHFFHQNVSHKTLLDTVEHLNKDPLMDGILVQLPLPPQIHTQTILDRIHPSKDVDGLHPFNFGECAMRDRSPCLIPCTAKGIIELLQYENVELEGKTAVIIGRSNLVGNPISMLLRKHDATIIQCHSKTINLPQYVKQADIVIAACGAPHLIRGSWLQKGSVVIDVGINFVSGKTQDQSLIGDVCFEEALGIASLITPVPGGVGPMTIAMLLKNVVTAYKQTH